MRKKIGRAGRLFIGTRETSYSSATMANIVLPHLLPGADKDATFKVDIPIDFYRYEMNGNFYKKNHMSVTKVSLLIDYYVEDFEKYGFEEDFTMEEFLTWGKDNVLPLIRTFGGIDPTFEEYKTRHLFCVDYSWNPDDGHRDFTDSIEKSYKYSEIVKEVAEDDKFMCQRDGKRYYPVTGELEKITLTYTVAKN